MMERPQGKAPAFAHEPKRTPPVPLIDLVEVRLLGGAARVEVLHQLAHCADKRSVDQQSEDDQN